MLDADDIEIDVDALDAKYAVERDKRLRADATQQYRELKTVDWLQWYDFQAEPGGVLGSDAHPRGSIECLSVLEGELAVEVGDVGQTARAGETLRYRCDRPHRIRNLSSAPAHATMVCILKAAARE